MAKPNVDTRWASNEITIPVIDINGNSVLVLNRLEPTTQYKDTGLQPLVPITGGALNYKLYADYLMIEWLRAQEIGTILEFEDGTMDQTQLELDRGGSWDDLGTVSRGYSGGSVTVRGFQKTA